MFKLIKEYGWRKVVGAGLAEIFRKLWRETVRGSYAQNWEDLEIEKIIGKKEKGFYLEIGAYHPTRLSNTYRFYKMGWRGVVVEPNPGVISLFKEIRPRDVMINKGIGVKGGYISYYQYLIPALNTFSKKQVKINKDKGYRVNKTEKIEVIAVTDFLKKYNKKRKIDVLSIDTEGWDEGILKKWEWRYKPKIICVETDKNQRIGRLLETENYVLKFQNKGNAIYAVSN